MSATLMGDMILIGEHGDGSARWGRVTEVDDDDSTVTVEPEFYRPAEVAPGVYTLDTLRGEL